MTNKSLPMPITVKPYLHQQQAFDFACMRFGLLPSDFRSNGVALLMEMGTGKTITSIGISGILYQFGRVNRILVVAPLSILGVWEEEFEKFAAFPYTLTILKGTSAKKRQQLSEVGKTDGLEIVVVNYESARILEPELLKYNADLIIADEGHKLKENRSQQSKTMHTLGDHARYKLLLTGTLITNREIDAYSQYRYADGIVYFRSVANNGYSGELEIALIPEWFRTDILQEKLDSNGVLVEKSDNAESVKFALLFEFDGDVRAIRHVMYNCTASRPSIESETKEDTIEPGTEKLSLTADPREDGLVKSRTGDTTSAETYQNWYKAVYTPVEEPKG